MKRQVLREPYVEQSAGSWADTQNYDISEEGWADSVAELTSGKLGKVLGQAQKSNHLLKRAWTGFREACQDVQIVLRWLHRGKYFFKVSTETSVPKVICSWKKKELQ